MLFYADMKKAELHAPQRSPGSLSKSAHFPRRYNSWQCEDTWLLLLPVVSGISYEILRAAGKSDAGWIRILSAPGLLCQRLTVKEPDDSMIECAIASVNAVFDWRQWQEENFGDHDAS